MVFAFLLIIFAYVPCAIFSWSYIQFFCARKYAISHRIVTCRGIRSAELSERGMSRFSLCVCACVCSLRECDWQCDMSI